MCNGIARAGNGVCLMSTTTEGIISKTSKLVKAAKTEFLQDITIDWGTPSLSLFFARWCRASQGQVLRQGPRTLPLLYGGVRLVVFSVVKHKRFKIPDEVVIQARRGWTGEIVRFVVAVKQLERSTSGLQTGSIHTLAARWIIMDLEDRERGVTSPSTRKAIIQLGQQYQLASRFTSFIAVEDENQKKLGVAPLPDELSERKSGHSRIQSHSYTAPPTRDLPSYFESDEYLGGEEYGVSRSRHLPTAPLLYATATDTGRREYMVSDVSSRSISRSSYAMRVPPSPVAAVPPSPYSLPPLSFAPVAVSNTDPVEQLARLQSFDGAFSMSTEAIAIFGRSAVDAGKKHKVDDRVWATILAIAYLQKHLAHEPELLEGLLEKAMAFLNHAQGNDQQHLLDIAGELIP